MTATDLITAIAEADAESLPAIAMALAARMAATRAAPLPAPAPEPVAQDNETLTIAEAAACLKRGPKWIHRNRKKLPFIRQLGPRSYVASKQGLERWLARR
jgi:hypothetical protein